MNVRHLDAALSVALIGAALAVAVAAIARVVPSNQPAVRPQYVDTWQDGLDNAIFIGGAPAAYHTLLVFNDLQCPACRAYHELVTTTLLANHGQQMRVLHVDFLLEYHPHAVPAARAAHCASRRGAYLAWVDAVFAKQDSLGLKSWASYAEDAGIANAAAIEACARDETRDGRIGASLAYGKRLGAHGTPTVILDGWRFPSPPTIERILSATRALERGKAPE